MQPGVDICITTAASPALNLVIALLNLGLVAGSNLYSDSNLRLQPAITCQLTAESLCKTVLRWRAACHCIMASQIRLITS